VRRSAFSRRRQLNMKRAKILSTLLFLAWIEASSGGLVDGLVDFNAGDNVTSAEVVLSRRNQFYITSFWAEKCSEKCSSTNLGQISTPK
jgi:hypothetical protein